MARRTTRPQPTRELELPTLTRPCPECGAGLWAAYKTRRTVTTLEGLVRLSVQVRRCRGMVKSCVWSILRRRASP